VEEWCQPPNNALQTDKVKPSCLLHSQKPRQLAFAAELGRYTALAAGEIATTIRQLGEGGARMFRALACAGALILGALGVSSSAQDTSDFVLPNAVVWGPASAKLPAGAQIAVIFGDMSKSGELYAFRAKLPDGYHVPPHTHPMDEHVTVIQGVLILGFGKSTDETQMRELPAASYVTLPKGVPHYNRMKGETILQFHGIGPYDINYVNPADDPSRQ
jgi:mannose-6-phosphate isomerase-like protein (cupin superfamily)